MPDVDMVFIAAKKRIQGANTTGGGRFCGPGQNVTHDSKSSRKLTLQEFKEAVKLFSEKLGKPLEVMEEYFVMKLREGPRVRSTTVEQVRLHDDEDTWTGE